MPWPLAGSASQHAIEQRQDVGIGEGVHPHPDRPIRERVGFECRRRPLEH